MQDRPIVVHHGDLELQGIYSLAVLDLPPDVDPLLVSRLSRRVGEPIEGAGLIVHTPRPVDPSEPRTTLEIRGWPDPRLPRVGTHPTEPIKYLKGHRIELFGGTVGPNFPAPKERLWEVTVTKPDGHPYTLQFLAWRQRAYLGASGLYAELRWHPGLDADHVRFGGLGRHKPKDLERLDRAIGLLRRLRRGWGGRPDRYTEANEPQLFEDLKTAAHAAVRNGERVNFSSLARHGSASRPTITAAVEEFDYDLDALEAEAVRCTQGLSICTVIWRRRAEFKKKRP